MARQICAHGHSEGQILTLVDPDTLEFIEDVNIEAGSGAITYNAKRDIYAISQGGKSLLRCAIFFSILTTTVNKSLIFIGGKNK